MHGTGKRNDKRSRPPLAHAPTQVVAWSTRGWTTHAVDLGQPSRSRRSRAGPTLMTTTSAMDSNAALPLPTLSHSRPLVAHATGTVERDWRQHHKRPANTLPTAAVKRQRTGDMTRPALPALPCARASTVDPSRRVVLHAPPQPRASVAIRNKRIPLATVETQKPVLAERADAAPALMPSAKEPAAFTSVAPRSWERVRPLGCGTFGCVHQVIHPDTGEHVALKEMGLLPDDYRSTRDGPPAAAFRPGISPPSVHMAFRELAAAAALAGHPSVAMVRDARLVMSPRADIGARIECALLMDLMDGHLGRIIRFMAGRTDASLSSSSSSSSSSAVSVSAALFCRQSLQSLSLSSSTTTTSLSSSTTTTTSLPAPTTKPTAAATTTTMMMNNTSGPATVSSLNKKETKGSPTSPSSSVAPNGPSPHAAPTRGNACPFELRVRLARMVARDILPALAFMHERLGLAHRDIKPNNILYADDVASGTLRFRLADFGLARFVRRPGPSQKLSTSTRQKKRRPPAAPTDDSVAVTSARSAGTTARKAKDADRRTQSAPPDLRPSTTADDSAVIDLASFATHFTANVVTHIYKPPEILLHYNTRNAMKDGLVYDCAVDMWSFGIVIMEVLAGGHLTPTEPEETLVRRVRAVFRLDGPRRPHLIRDLVWGMASRAALGRSGISSISRTAPVTETGDDDGAHGDLYVDLIDLVERLLCVDPEQRISATNALAHAFVVGSRRPSRQSALVTSPTSAAATTMMGKAQATTKTKSQSDDTITPTDDVKEDDKNHNTDHLQVDAMEGYRKGTGPAHDGGVDDGAHDLEPKFLAPCAYRALAKGTHGVDQRPCIRTPSSKSLTLAARRVAVKRACIFAQRHGLGTYTVASAVAMLDQCIEMGRVSDDETLLVTMAGALLVACCLYECHWPAHDQFALMGVVPTLWYGLEQRPPSIGVRTPPADAPLRAAVSLFSALGHLTPQPAPLSALIDGSLALAIERKDTNPWRAMTATFSRYPPSTVRLRR